MVTNTVTKTRSFVMIGPQGCGKGTQADLMAKEYGIPHISTGDIFRAMQAEDTPLSRKVKEYMLAGKLVPDDIVMQTVVDRLKKADVKAGFILDGVPRNIPQADFLDKQVKITKAILVDIADDEAVKRISARRNCEKCKQGYNTIYLKPKKEGVCDKCGGKLVIREDDKPAVVRARLKKYHDETEPIIKYYEKKGVLVRVDGAQPIEKVFQDIKKSI